MAADGHDVSHRNWVSFLGAALTTASAVVFLLFVFVELAGWFPPNPYLGIVTFLLLPAVFVVGLVLIPLGLWRARRRRVRGEETMAWPVLDFGRPQARRAALIILVLTGVNLAIVALASYKSVEYVDSTAFCTGACHSPMRPEAVAHQRTVHASISCASCHVGPGTQGFVRAKMGGVRRLAAVTTGSYARPIDVPVHDLPSAAGTCAGCHTPTAYVGDVTRSLRAFSDDEASTEQVTTMTFRVGGGGWEGGGPHGIHWHASPSTKVEYVATDDKREHVAWIRVTDQRGAAREYTIDGFSPDQIAGRAIRTMDCTDCHNRQGHAIAASPERAVDEALATGLLPRALPYARREAVAALKGAGGDIEAAQRAIADRLTTFYGATGAASDARVAQAIAASQRLYSDNVFPAMKITWGTYPSHLGHTDAPGCFRCHDEQHKTTTGKVVTQDCELCHRM
jgi:hypothetical protein